MLLSSFSLWIYLSCLHSLDLIFAWVLRKLLISFSFSSWLGKYIFIIFSNNYLLISLSFSGLFWFCMFEKGNSCESRCLEARKGVRFGARVTAAQCGCWEPSSGLLQEDHGVISLMQTFCILLLYYYVLFCI